MRAAVESGSLRSTLVRVSKKREGRIGLALVSLLLLFAIFGPLFAGHDPHLSDFSIDRDRFGAPQGPSPAHWLGVDALQRDLLARLAEGAQVSLFIALSAAILSTTLGALVGVSAAMSAGTRFAFLDTALMRLCDAWLALPFLLFITAVGVAVGHAELGTILLVLGIGGFAPSARVVREQARKVLALDFVMAARALGASGLRIAWSHVVPNVAGTLIVLGTTSVGQMILAEAVLSYLTMGAPPPISSWGRMLHEGEPFLGTRLSLIGAPGLAILLSVLGFSRLGDALRDALDPRDPLRLAAERRLPVDLLLVAAAFGLLVFAVPNEVAPPLSRAAASASPRRGGVLRVATHVNLRSLDPALAFDEVSRSLSELVFARLVNWDSTGKLVPELAREVIPSADHRAYTFVLREGVVMHDGSKLDASQVKRSLERLLHPSTPSPGASFYASIKGFEDYREGRSPELRGVRVTGEHALVIELEQADATFLPKMTLTFAAPVCASSGASADPKSARLPCGAGPFVVESFDADRGVRLSRHEGYYLPGKPYLDGVEWFVGVPASSQAHKFERGELDYTRELPTRYASLYRATRTWEGSYRYAESQATNGIFLNTEAMPFRSRALRRAVSLAIDPRVLEKIRPDIFALSRVVPPSIPGQNDRAQMRRYDREAALAEMARAGYAFDPKTGKGGYPGVIDYIAVSDTWDQQSAEIWQQQLAQIGIRIRLKLVTYATFLADSSRRGATAIGKGGWGADFPDPSNFFEPLFSTAAISDEQSQNVSFFSNPELDALLERAHGEGDEARRMADYERAEQIIRDEAPWIPTFGTRVFEIWQPYVRGYEAHAVIKERFNEVWLDRSEARAGLVKRGAFLGAIGWGRSRKARP